MSYGMVWFITCVCDVLANAYSRTLRAQSSCHSSEEYLLGVGVAEGMEFCLAGCRWNLHLQ